MPAAAIIKIDFISCDHDGSLNYHYLTLSTTYRCESFVTNDYSAPGLIICLQYF